MAQYVCHYAAPTLFTNALTCGDLARAITEFPLGGVEALDISELWVAVDRLQWSMVCARVISAQDVAALLGGLTREELEEVRLAVCRLVAAIPAKYPALADVDRPTLVQLVALGHDQVKTCGESREYFGYLQKQELQALDLAALLRV
jgi:hypothetical protein